MMIQNSLYEPDRDLPQRILGVYGAFDRQIGHMQEGGIAMPTTDSYIDVVLGANSHRIQIKHEERPCDAYIAVDGQQVSSRLKMLPFNGGAHFFEVEGHRLALVIARSEPDQPWEYDCFVDDESVVNGMPFWFGKADLVTVKRWEKSRRGGKLNYWLMACAKGALIGCAIFLLLFIGGWIGRMEITWLHLIVSVAPLVALYAIFVPFEWKNNESAYEKYLTYRRDASEMTEDMDTAVDPAKDVSTAAEDSDVTDGTQEE